MGKHDVTGSYNIHFENAQQQNTMFMFICCLCVCAFVDSHLANDAIFLFGFYSYFLIKSTTKTQRLRCTGQCLRNYKGFALCSYSFVSFLFFSFSVRKLFSLYLQLLVNKLNRLTSLGCNLKEKKSFITHHKRQNIFQVYSFICNINRSHHFICTDANEKHYRECMHV